MKKSILGSMQIVCLTLVGFLSSTTWAEPMQYSFARSKVPIEKLPLDDGLEDIEEDEPPVEAIPLEEIQYFVKIYQIAKDNYVQAVTDTQLFDQAIQGLIGGLDRYSRYLNPEQYQQLLQYSEGDLATLDVQLHYQEKKSVWQIYGIEKNSNLAKSGLQNGYTLQKIDETPVKGMSEVELAELMKGVYGTAVNLHMAEMSQPVVLIRQKKLSSELQHQLLPKQTLLLKINVFQQNTANEMKQLIEFYQTEHKIKSVLIDLRNNPGGLLASSIEAADLFLDQGLIVTTKGRAEPEQTFQALPSREFHDLKLGILINGRSASAAEVFTAALKEHQRAIVLGERSYGKGAIQKLFALQNGAALQMTVAHYYTPKGTMIEGVGIQPQLKVSESNTPKNDQFIQYVNDVFQQAPNVYRPRP